MIGHGIIEDLTGRTFGRWIVMGRAPRTSVRVQWICRCECGTEKPVAACHLKSGASSSCGCRRTEVTASRARKHGFSKNDKRGEYRIWMQMRARCRNENLPAFKDYGGRGIKVCDRWQASFAAFFADMGPRPSPKHTLDRIDVNGNYEPNNCRWATIVQQARNTRRNHLVTLDGETMCLAEAVERRGLKYGTVKWRLAQGIPVDEAFK